MQAVKYARAASVEEASRLLAEGGVGARVLAGGTDVIVQARERTRDIDLFVDIKHIPEVMALSYDADSGLTIGAATPCFEIYASEAVRDLYPSIVDSTSLIGGTAIQGRASLGGNLCNSSPAADGIPTLIVLEATVEIAGPNGRRSVAVEDFCTAPGRNVLESGEFVISLNLPTPAAGSGARFLRFIPRNEMDIAVTNAATQVRIEAGVVSWARVSIGAVAPDPAARRRRRRRARRPAAQRRDDRSRRGRLARRRCPDHRHARLDPPAPPPRRRVDRTNHPPGRRARGVDIQHSFS